MEKSGKSLEAEGKHCENCGKAFLFGRADRRFCNDHCRNTFNRKKAEREKIQAHENLPEIFRIIKRNYELLKKHGGNTLMGADEGVFFDKEQILQEGFNPKFFTSTTEIDGSLWRFCFERGWQMGETDFLIRDRPEQAEVQ